MSLDVGEGGQCQVSQGDDSQARNKEDLGGDPGHHYAGASGGQNLDNGAIFGLTLYIFTFIIHIGSLKVIEHNKPTEKYDNNLTGKNC